MTIQCVFCHRVLIGERWVDCKPEGQVLMSACPACIQYEKQKSG